MGWLWWWLVSCDGRLLLFLLLGIEEWVIESLTIRGEREKKKKDRIATVTVHICTITVVIVHKCIILHPGVFFSQNV